MPLIRVTPGSPEWLAARRAGIGASDAAAVLGLDKYRSPLDVWADKLGLLEAKPPTLPMEVGLMLEGAVAQLYVQQEGGELRAPGGMHVDADHPWMMATLDRYRLGTQTLVELKTAGYWAGQEWGDEYSLQVPRRYVVQCQHQMAVTGRTRADLAVLIENSRFSVHHIERDETIIREIREQLEDFWKTYVETETEPPATGADEATLRELHDQDDGSVVTPTEEQLEVIGNYAQALRAAAFVDEGVKQGKAAIIQYLGDATALDLPGGEQITYKTSKPSTRWKEAAHELADALAAEFGAGLPKNERDELVKQYVAQAVEATRPEVGSRKLVTPASWKDDQE